MSLKENKIAVIYLMWLPYGMSDFQAFIHSYKTCRAGMDHDLLIAFKDETDPESNSEPYRRYLDEEGIVYKPLYIPNEGFDITSFREIAGRIHHDLLLFFNTRSVILEHDWLTKYQKAFESGNLGVVSATASNQSHYTSVFQTHQPGWEKGKGLYHHFRKYKLFIKAFFYWRFLFPAFPNPHIRTNAFMVRRDDFLRLRMGVLSSKLKAYFFESGRNGLTRQFLQMGYEVAIIDRNGKTYSPAEWHRSAVFWQHDQQNLLVADNQTRFYENSGEDQKAYLSRQAWGNHE